jgi:ABC-2 type transport system permease protein
MMSGWTAVYYREILILRRRLSRLVGAWSVSPLLYLIAFGYAMGKGVTVQGHTYLEYLIPGLVAMSSMTQAFAIGSEINIARFYWHIFEEFQAAPISHYAYVLGEVLAGITRAFLAVAVVLTMGLLFGVRLSLGPCFWLGIFLNSFVFASLAVGLAMMVKSHGDQAMLTSFVITPMAFLGGTFFPVDRLPEWMQWLLSVLPITHAAHLIRNAALGGELRAGSISILSFYAVLFFVLAVFAVRRAKD